MKSEACEIQITPPLPMLYKHNRLVSGAPCRRHGKVATRIQAVAPPRVFFVRLAKFQLERASGQAFPAEAILAAFHILYARLTEIFRNYRQEGTAM